MNLRIILLACLISLTGACGNPIWLPPAHKIDIQQGNLVDQEQVVQLREGMSRDEVRQLLGEPVLKPTVDADRWDYVYTKGRSGEHVKARRLTVFFEQERVSRIEDDYAPLNTAGN
ncbi:outer membrane protein assembly factor BamE [Granulosicoccaceae sp. 1_MG-2023]|nr:outer membrane protein assembly factor BamE [Granulosicoccaceae sp. 1_MG-2023]